MMSNDENLAKLNNQNFGVKQRIEKLELEIKMANATGKNEVVQECEKEIFGLRKLAEELDLQITELSKIVEAEEQIEIDLQQKKIEKAQQEEILVREEHAKKAKKLETEGNLMLLLGFVSVVAYTMYFFDFSMRTFQVYFFGILSMVYGGMQLWKAKDERAYASGISEEQLLEIKSNVHQQIAKENRANEALAKAISREIKK